VFGKLLKQKGFKKIKMHKKASGDRAPPVPAEGGGATALPQAPLAGFKGDTLRQGETGNRKQGRDKGEGEEGSCRYHQSLHPPLYGRRP